MQITDINKTIRQLQGDNRIGLGFLTTAKATKAIFTPVILQNFILLYMSKWVQELLPYSKLLMSPTSWTGRMCQLPKKFIFRLPLRYNHQSQVAYSSQLSGQMECSWNILAMTLVSGPFPGPSLFTHTWPTVPKMLHTFPSDNWKCSQIITAPFRSNTFTSTATNNETVSLMSCN